MPFNQKITFQVLLTALMLQVISICYYLYFTHYYGYLPSPFTANKSDTFMDLYNTLWWGTEDGRYTEWQSIYPPLNFIIVGMMRAIFLRSGVGSDPVYARVVSLWPAYVVIAVHLIAPAFIVTRSSWGDFTKANRALIALVAMLSPIFLFSMERGNLIVLPLFLLPFIFAKRDGWWKPLLLAIAINLKPYLAVLIFAYAFAGNWRRFLQSLAFAGAIFLLTGLMEDPNFLLFLKNLPSFAGGAALQPQAMLALPSSPSALTRAILMYLNNTEGEIPGKALLSPLPPLIEAIKTGAIILGLLGLFLRRRAAQPTEAFALLLVLAVMAGIWAGGYSQIFFLAAVPVLATMRFGKAYLLLLGAIFLPWDLVTLHTDPPVVDQSFITHQTVWVDWHLGLGSLIRPLLNTVLIATLGTELMMRKNPPDGQTSSTTRALDLIPDWRFILPTGIAGLVIGAIIYNFALSSHTAVAVIRTRAEAAQSDPQGSLRLFLNRRTTQQLTVATLQTFAVADKIAMALNAPDLASKLAGRQYGGDGALSARLTTDTQFLEVRITLPDPVSAVKSAAIAADIAMQMDDGTLSMPPAKARVRLQKDWQQIGIQTAISPALSDQLVSLRDAYHLQDNAEQTGIFMPAALSTPMINSWWLAAMLGGVACGATGYAIGLSQSKQKREL